MEFYVTIPGDKSAQKYTVADVVSNEAFKMICKYTSTKSSQNCAALWLYGSTDRRLAEMTGSTGKGKIGDPYQSAAVNRMNATFEGHSGGMRIELDVFKATRELFDFDSYYCRCVNINSAQQHVQLKIHDPTAPMNMEVYQDPGPPYLEGQTVRLKCLSEAWPSKTTYQILANQFSLFTQEVSNSRDGIEYSVVIDDAVHKNVECVATNKMGSNKKQYTMVIHVKAKFFDTFDVQSEIGSRAKLVWNFMAFPFPVIGKITLRKDGFPLNYGQPPFTYSLKSINATQGSFELWVPVNSQDDYGSYSLNVTNNAGSNIHKIVLNYTVNPLLPTLIEFKPISPEETLIVWHMRDEDFGGRTDFFQLKTWDLDSGDPEPREDVVDASADQHDYSHKLTGLQLFGVYVTQLRSCNEDGLCSPWSEQQTLNLSDPQMFRQTEQETTARASAVLISFFVVIAVCTLLLLAAAIFICRKKCHEKKMNEQRQLPRYADGYASMPSRTVMRVPPPSSPGKQPFSTLDWSNTYRPVLEFENLHSGGTNANSGQAAPMAAKDCTDAEMQTQSDPDLLEHIKRLNARPPLASLGSKSKLSVGSNTDTTSGYPFATMKNNHHLNDNSFVTFHGDPNDVTPDYQHETESEVLSPPLAIVDDEFHIEESPYSHLHHRINPQPHPEAGTHGLMTRISRTGNI